jgi:hypothetical protein
MAQVGKGVLAKIVSSCATSAAQLYKPASGRLSPISWKPDGVVRHQPAATQVLHVPAQSHAGGAFEIEFSFEAN